MHQEKIKIFHFHNGKGGGVLSVIRNLLAFRQNPDIENHVIYTINKDETPQYNILNLEGANSEKVFYYSPNWNFFYTAKQLKNLLLTKNVILVAHDWLELAMISNLGLNYPVVQFLHGDYDYYFRLAQRNEAWVDSFICVSSSIADELIKRIPERINDIHYIRFPVPEIIGVRVNTINLELVFAGRCEESKGYHLLPLIDAELQQKKIHANWHIAGPGSDQLWAQQQWKKSRVHFYGNLSPKELTALLLKATAFVLPSIAEGMPLTVVEAMKAGAIPVVNDLKGGLQELVINNVTGYLVPNNDPLIFAERIAAITADAEMSKQISDASVSFAQIHFDPIENTRLMEYCFIQTATLTKKKIAKKTTGSRLDQPYLPNIIVSILRSL